MSFIEGQTGCSVEDVLVFATGSESVPALGFEKMPSVVFSSTGRFCTASTCDLVLRLPTTNGENYDAFKEAMIMSLKDNDGFGGL